MRILLAVANTPQPLNVFSRMRRNFFVNSFRKLSFRSSQKLLCGYDASDDLFSSLEKEHAKERRLRVMPSGVDLEEMILNVLPQEHRNSQAALQNLREYFTRNKINDFIPCEQIRITGVETDGLEASIDKNKQYSVTEAISLAKSVGCDLVMMAEREGVAYCRIKNERKRALEKVQHLLTTSDSSNNQSSHAPKKLGATEEYLFRDVIDAFTINWKSKYVVQALKKNKPVKLMCEKFSSPMSAFAKFQEFLRKIQEVSEPENVKYNAMQITVSERVFAVLLTPTPGAQQSRVPNKNDWDRAMGRFKAAFERSAREDMGTWKHKHKKKARSSGPSLFRTDKYGNRISSVTDSQSMNLTPDIVAKRRADGEEILSRGGYGSMHHHHYRKSN